MKREIELARSRAGHTEELAGLAREARDRVDAYNADEDERTLAGQERLRDLERARDLAEVRLRRAQSDVGEEAGEPPPPEPVDESDDDEGPGGAPLRRL